tara:strand:- start:1337 stop:1681 length:345 start_codon:yes stop_codon:yes gene_type:complete
MTERSQSNTKNQLPESSTTEPLPVEEPTLYIYFLKNLKHRANGTNNDAIVIAQNEPQARRIANDSLQCNEGGREFTISKQPNFWELDEYSSIRRIGTADKGLWVQLVSYNWTGN